MRLGSEQMGQHEISSRVLGPPEISVASCSKHKGGRNISLWQVLTMTQAVDQAGQVCWTHFWDKPNFSRHCLNSFFFLGPRKKNVDPLYSSTLNELVLPCCKVDELLMVSFCCRKKIVGIKE